MYLESEPEKRRRAPARYRLLFPCPRRRVAIWSGFLLPLGLALSGVRSAPAERAAAPDANALVRKMVATYQRASTIQETSEARIVNIPSSAGEFVQAATLKYKKPNRLMLESQDPDIGTLAAYAKGDTITLYGGKQNVFTIRTAPKTFAKTIALIEKTGAELARKPLSIHMLNPLGFLLAKGMPVEAQSFRYVNMQTVEGRKTYAVAAQASAAWMRTQVPNRSFTPDRRDILLNIDAKTNLLVRASALLTWKRPVRVVGSSQTQNQQIGGRLIETHRGTTLNAPIADSVFDFNAHKPKGATEIYQEHH